MSKAPAFQFYAADFLLGTMGMDDAEIGIYIKMLAVQWDRGSLPNCAKTIKKLISSRKLPSDLVLTKFSICDDGLLRNLRLEKERNKQESFRNNRVVAGSAGGKMRAERIASAKKLDDHTRDDWEEMKSFFGECCKCGEKTGLCKDHILPIYQGGSNGITNLQTLCTRCNSSKGPDSTDFREIAAARIGKQLPSKWVASATEKPKQNVALLSSSSSSLSLARELKAQAPDRSLSPPSASDESSPFADRLPTEAANDFDALFARINAIHPSWRKHPHPTQIEMEAALANAKTLFAIEQPDWDALKAFYALASFPPEWEEKAKGGVFWRPESRSRFIQGITDVLGHLDRWQACKRKGGKAA